MEQIAGEPLYPGGDVPTEPSWTIFFMYLIAGVITGIMMFGFAEIVNLLDKGNDLKQEQLSHLHSKSEQPKPDLEPGNKENSITKDEINETTEEPKTVEEEIKEVKESSNMSNDMKNAMIASIKRREGIE